MRERALTSVGNRALVHIQETKLWHKIIWENCHLNDRGAIVEESARTLRELRAEEEFLKSIIIYFKDENFEIPARWWRIVCPNTLRRWRTFNRA